MLSLSHTRRRYYVISFPRTRPSRRREISSSKSVRVTRHRTVFSEKDRREEIFFFIRRRHSRAPKICGERGEGRYLSLVITPPPRLPGPLDPPRIARSAGYGAVRSGTRVRRENVFFFFSSPAGAVLAAQWTAHAKSRFFLSRVRVAIRGVGGGACGRRRRPIDGRKISNARVWRRLAQGRAGGCAPVYVIPHTRGVLRRPQKCRIVTISGGGQWDTEGDGVRARRVRAGVMKKKRKT